MVKGERSENLEPVYRRPAWWAIGVVLFVAVIAAACLLPGSSADARIMPVITADRSAAPTLSPTPTGTPTESVIQSPGDETPIPSQTNTPTATRDPLPAALERARSFSGTNEEWEPFVWNFDGTDMVLVPAGCFIMGSTVEQITVAFEACQAQFSGCQEEWLEDETPAHRVCLREPFWLDRTEVTRAMYAECVAAGACETVPLSNDSSQDNRPINSTTWDEAKAYCSWRNARLPTEAEWEYAARGPDGLLYPWGNDFDGTQANFCDVNCPRDWRNTAYDDGYEKISAVDSYPDGASWVGALGMSGNVWEWMADWYVSDYYRLAPDVSINPRGPMDGDTHTVRSGSSGTLAFCMRAANREGNNGGERPHAGLRCVRSVSG